MSPDALRVEQLYDWWARFGDDRQHAWRGGRVPGFSLCGRVRWSAASVERDRTARFCPECLGVVRVETSDALDYLAASEAERVSVELALQGRARR